MKLRLLSTILSAAALIAGGSSCAKHSWEETQVLHEKYKPEHGEGHGDAAKEHGAGPSHGEGAKTEGHGAPAAKHE